MWVYSVGHVRAESPRMTESTPPRSLFESILPAEKLEALARGENVTVTAEEVTRFQLAYESARDHEIAELHQKARSLQAQNPHR